MRNKMNPVALPVALNAQKNTGDALHFAVPGAARIKERKAVAFETATFSLGVCYASCLQHVTTCSCSATAKEKSAACIFLHATSSSDSF